MNDKEILDYSAELISYKKEIETGEATEPDIDEQVRLKFKEDSINRSKFIDSTIIIGAASKEFRNTFGVDAPHYEISEDCHLAVDKNGNGQYSQDEFIEIKDDALHIKGDPYSFMDCQEIINAARFDSTINVENKNILPVKDQRFFVDSKKDQESSQYHHPVCPPGFDRWAGRKVYDYICKNYDLNEITLYKIFSNPEANTIPSSFTINQTFNGDNPFECNINELGMITKNSFNYTFDINQESELQKAYNNGDFRMPKEGCEYKDDYPIKWYSTNISVSSERRGNKYFYSYDYTGSPFQFTTTPFVQFQLISRTVFNSGYAILCMDPKTNLELTTEGDKYRDGSVTIRYCVHILWKENENLDNGASYDKNRRFLWWSWTTRTNKNYTVTFNPVSSVPDEVKTKVASFLKTTEDDCLKYYDMIEERDINTVIPDASTSVELMENVRDLAEVCSSSASSASSNWGSLMDALFVRTAYDILEEKVDKFSSAASYASSALVYKPNTQYVTIPNPDYEEPQPVEGLELFTRSDPDETLYEYDTSQSDFVEVDDEFDITKTYFVEEGGYFREFRETPIEFYSIYISPDELDPDTTYYTCSGYTYYKYEEEQSDEQSEEPEVPQYITAEITTREVFKSKTNIAPGEWDSTKWEDLGIFKFEQTPTTVTSITFSGETQYITQWKGFATKGWPKFLMKLLFKQTWEPVYSTFPQITIISSSTKRSFNTLYPKRYTLSRDEYLGPPEGDITKTFSGNHMKTPAEIIDNILSVEDKAYLKSKNLLANDESWIIINGVQIPKTSNQDYEVIYESRIEELPTYNNIKRAQTIDNFLTTNSDLFKNAFNTLGDRIDKRTGTLRKTYSLLESASINAQMAEQRKGNIDRLSKSLNAYSISGGFGTKEVTINLATWEPYTSAYSALPRGSTVYVVGDNTQIATETIDLGNKINLAPAGKPQTIKVSRFSKNYVKTTITDIIDFVSDTQYDYSLTKDTEVLQNKTYYVIDDRTDQYRVAKESDLELATNNDMVNQMLYERGNPTAGPVFKVKLNCVIPNLFKGNNPRLVKVY